MYPGHEVKVDQRKFNSQLWKNKFNFTNVMQVSKDLKLKFIYILVDYFYWTTGNLAKELLYSYLWFEFWFMLTWYILVVSVSSVFSDRTDSQTKVEVP
jgi:hypothetical protein